MPSTAIALPPLLREGDHLDSKEFLRRWDAMPDLKRAELIDGIVTMPSPVSRPHATIHGKMSGWLYLYDDSTPGCEFGLEGSWVMSGDSVPQPDLFLRMLPEFGGQSGEERGLGAGAPELIVEMSGSTLTRDLGVKMELYRRTGVREYITVVLNPRQIIWRELSRGRYREIKADDDGLLRSRVFPGLWLDPDAVWSAKKSLRKVVEKGIESPEHAAFVRRLATARKKK